MNPARTSATHFANLSTAPPDPVFGLAEMYRNDPNPNKINLTVGAYQNEDGITPVLQCVRQAEKQIWSEQKTKNYLPIDGLTRYRQLIQKLILGDGHEAISASRVATIQTPGGTGALRLAADFVQHVLGRKAIWISDPTWANHSQIFNASGLEVRSYRYLNADQTDIDLAGICERLQSANSGDVVLLHTICHNPTGFDLDREGWLAIFEIIERRNLLPLFDFAYQGFGTNVEEDAWPVRHFCRELPEVFICNSFSKNLGMYSERVGALSLVMAEAPNASAALSHVKHLVRTIYSTPPEHGGKVAETVLSDPELRALWLKELAEMRIRIRELRERFVARLAETVPTHDFSFVLRQCGMFSYSGLSRKQVIRLREEFSIYLVESGRINIAGINGRNLDRICQAIATVI